MMNWQDALTMNNGDYAYAGDGGMLDRKDDGTYTALSGNINAACAGDWSNVERTGLAEEDIPDALAQLGMSEDGWSFE
jgi:hypothetical protein